MVSNPINRIRQNMHKMILLNKIYTLRNPHIKKRWQFMYTDSAYWHNKVLDFKDKSKPIMVCSCGTYHLFTRPKLPTHRPRGRLDWQLLYIASGKAHFYFNGVEEIVTAGNLSSKRGTALLLLWYRSYGSILGSFHWRGCKKYSSFVWFSRWCSCHSHWNFSGI